MSESETEKEISEYYKCPADECPSREVYDHFPTLVLHYTQEHRGLPKITIDKAAVQGIPEGYHLYTKVKGGKSSVTHDDEHDDEHRDKSNDTNVYRQTPEPASILQKILETYPGLDKGTAAEIMNWVELKGTLHPMEVKQLLANMSGVPKGCAEILPQKYQFALMKAAQEGEAEVKMALSGWGGAFLPPDGKPGTFTSGGGLFGMDQVNPMFRYGVNPAMMKYQYFPWMNPGGFGADSSVETAADAAKNKEIDELKQGQNQLNKTIETLLQRITETEEQKKEAALNARFEKLEGHIGEIVTALSNPPKTDEPKDKALETLLVQFQETRAEMAKMREEASQAQIKSLEIQLTELSSHLKNQDDERVKKLESDLEDLRAKAKDSVVGRTEMDVINDLATKAIETIKDAGKDVKSIMLSGQNRERFNPARVDTAVRKEAGEKLVVALENDVQLTAAEAEYLQG